MSVEKCNQAALKYVASAVKTESKVREYLLKKGFSKDAVEASIGMLKSYKYIDDEKYCKLYYVEACRKGRGRRRIERELELKGIPGYLVKEVLNDYLSDLNPDYDEVLAETLTEKERAMKIVAKMMREQRDSGKVTDKNFCGKVGRRLAANGYSTDVIYYAIGKVMKESSDE